MLSCMLDMSADVHEIPVKNFILIDCLHASVSSIHQPIVTNSLRFMSFHFVLILTLSFSTFCDIDMQESLSR